MTCNKDGAFESRNQNNCRPGTKWQCVNKSIISTILVRPLSPETLVSMTSFERSACFLFFLIVLHLFQLRPRQHVQRVCWQEAADRRDGQSSGGDVCQREKSGEDPPSPRLRKAWIRCVCL